MTCEYFERPFRIPEEMLPGILEGNFECLSDNEIDQLTYFIDQFDSEAGEFVVIGGPNYFLPANVVGFRYRRGNEKNYDVTYDVEFKEL